jgi:hypothetical protein
VKKMRDMIEASVNVRFSEDTKREAKENLMTFLSTYQLTQCIQRTMDKKYHMSNLERLRSQDISWKKKMDGEVLVFSAKVEVRRHETFYIYAYVRGSQSQQSNLLARSSAV